MLLQLTEVTENKSVKTLEYLQWSNQHSAVNIGGDLQSLLQCHCRYQWLVRRCKSLQMMCELQGSLGFTSSMQYADGIVHLLKSREIARHRVAWPSGLRRWFKAPVSSEAWVRIPPLPRNFRSNCWQTACHDSPLQSRDRVVIPSHEGHKDCG